MTNTHGNDAFRKVWTVADEADNNHPGAEQRLSNSATATKSQQRLALRRFIKNHINAGRC